MRLRPVTSKPAALTLSILLCTQAALGAQISVLVSGAFTEAYSGLVPQFESATGNKIETGYGASMGGAPDSIPSRLQRGERVDIVILAASALEDLIKKGQILPDSRADLVRSSIGVAVKAGTPHPDISSVDALKRTLLQAKSIAYSASASGVYLSTELFPALGIADQIKSKSKRIADEPVGAVVARGDAGIGLQQISELLPVPGIDYIGPLPAEVQRVTVFSAGIAAASKEPAAARAFIKFLASPAAASAISKSGLTPITGER